jgi:hypothetical protein
MPCPGNLPTALKCAILIFAKGEAEKALNRGLHERAVNRVILKRPFY